MILNRAAISDFSAVCTLYESVCSAMQAAGIDQWRWGEYPNETMLRASLDAGTLYIAREDDALRPAYHLRIARDHAFGAERVEGELHARQVPRLVVDDCNHG